MSTLLTAETRGDALILRVRSGPTNALTSEVRRALLSAVETLGSGCHRIVLTGTGPCFSSAVPVEWDSASPRLAEVLTAMEHVPVPVIAVLDGLAMGPGAELALVARARIASQRARLAFLEVALGLCPEGGTTLRLPRLVGATRALDLLLTGRAVGAEEALSLGLVDLVADDPLAAALSVTTLPTRGTFLPAEPGVISAARRAHVGALPAVARLIGCVEAAALLPADAHLAFEAVAREDLEATPEAAALRSAARADRRAAELSPAIARYRPPPLARIALWGGGGDLVALAQAALSRGMEVAWHHTDPGGAATALAALDEAEAQAQRDGWLTAAARVAGRSRLTMTDSGTGDPALLQVHAGDMPASLRAPGAGEAHLVLGGAEGELGLELGLKGRLCELAIPAAEGAEAPRIAVAVAGLRQLGWQPLLVGRRPGLGWRVVRAGQAALEGLARRGVARVDIANALAGFGAGGAVPAAIPAPASPPLSMPAPEILARWLAAQANEALRALDQGMARRPSDIDLALVTGHGFPRWRGGPMHQAERRGLMALRHDLRSWAAEDPAYAPASLLDRLIQDGLRLADLDAA